MQPGAPYRDRTRRVSYDPLSNKSNDFPPPHPHQASWRELHPELLEMVFEMDIMQARPLVHTQNSKNRMRRRR